MNQTISSQDLHIFYQTQVKWETFPGICYSKNYNYTEIATSFNPSHQFDGLTSHLHAHQYFKISDFRLRLILPHFMYFFVPLCQVDGSSTHLSNTSILR